MKKIYVAVLCMCLFLSGCGSRADLLLDNGQYESVTELSDVSEAEAEATISEEKETIAVYIVGEIQTPGVYELPEGSRICNLVEAAGGFTENAAIEAFNLAEFLSDEQMIRVPDIEEYELMNIEAAEVTQESTDAASFSDSEKNVLININSASVSELTSLTGIGPAKAAAIIEYRTENGHFASIEEITQVPGIGEAIFLKIKNEITV